MVIRLSHWECLMLTHSHQLRGTLLVALSGVMYGCLGYLGTILLQAQFSIENMLFWRFFVALLWMMGWAYLRRDISAYQPARFSLLLKATLFASITYSGSSLFYFMATQRIGTGTAMVIFYAYPVFVMLFAWLLKRWQIDRYAFIALNAVVIGLCFLKGQGATTLNILGIVSAIVAGLCYAIYVSGSEQAVDQLPTGLLTLLVCLGNTLIYFLLSCVTQHFAWPTTLTTILCVLAIGIVATAIPIQLLLEGLKDISPVKASILSVLEPVVTLFIGFTLLHETLSSFQVMGIVIILAGALFIQFEKGASQQLPTSS